MSARLPRSAGVVASAKFAPGSGSQPKFLDFDKPYPNAAVIFGDDRPKFGTPETTLRGKRVCVTGYFSAGSPRPAVVVDRADFGHVLSY